MTRRFRSPSPTAGGRRIGRRGFLAVGGVSVAGLVAAGCGGDDGGGTGDTIPRRTEGAVIDFANPTLGVLNFAYALEQLEAAFYAQVNQSLYKGASDVERRSFQDIAAHERVHREFLKFVLGRPSVGALAPDFSSVDFDDRGSVLETALKLENLGVAAYNGAARLIDVGSRFGTVPLEAAGDIVAVEARHAAFIGSLIDGGRGGRRFAPEAFDAPMDPAAVLEAADPFISTPIRVENLRSQ